MKFNISFVWTHWRFKLEHYGEMPFPDYIYKSKIRTFVFFG